MDEKYLCMNAIVCFMVHDHNLQSPLPSRCNKSFMLQIFVESMCSENVGAFGCVVTNAADIVVVVANIFAFVKFTGTIGTGIDWAVENERISFVVESIFLAFSFLSFYLNFSNNW